VIAATNRPDIVDEALLRPGRLDYRLEVPKPDLAARAAVLAVHLRSKPVDEAVDVAALAAQTDGLSAAEVRFVCDRAAMNAVRRVFPTAGVTVAAVADLRIVQQDFNTAVAAQRLAGKI
jgi:transitional endoplasmic reticulum ATPase